MDKYQTSIFNDVLGPVMTGPSSSHTAAPWRIGYFIGRLMDQIIQIYIEFPDGGSYHGTYKGQKSDIAFVAGILGMQVTDSCFKDSFEIAEQRGILIQINISQHALSHPNLSYITIENAHQKICVESWSTGGGMFEIRSINGFPVSCKGNCHELVLFESSGEITNTKLPEAPSDINNGNMRYIPPILPVPHRDIHLPFTTADELKSFIKNNPMPLWKAAVLYESIRSGWSESEVLEFAGNLVEVMRQSIINGLKSDFYMSGFLTPSAQNIMKRMKDGPMIDTGVIGNAALYSLAVMEYNSAMGIVVASPTAGSCGVIPGVLFSLDCMDVPDMDKCAKALLCAGIIGVFIANQATFAAEVCGCQAEIGAASCMASAIAAFFLDSDIKTMLNAASMALQNMLGLICDPVAGYTEIPCISRNASAASNAIISANLAAGGFDSVIPLDETILAMFETGKMMPPELRCTGRGGLCVTKTGKMIDEKINMRGLYND